MTNAVLMFNMMMGGICMLSCFACQKTASTD